MSQELRAVPAAAEHFAEFVRLRAELGVDDPVPTLETWLAAVAPHAFVLELDGALVAYGWGQPLGRDGYVRHVVVDPAHRGRGFGKRVMAEHARRLRAAGCTHWRLNVLRGNDVAIGLYRALGFEHEYSTWVMRLDAARAAQFARADELARVRDIDASEDGGVELHFEFPAGLLAMHRERPGRRFVLAESPTGDKLAFAQFDPSYPGCWPLRAREPRFARATLHALLPDLPREAPWIQLVVERDRAVADALRDAGAVLKHEIEHFSGPIQAS